MLHVLLCFPDFVSLNVAETILDETFKVFLLIYIEAALPVCHSFVMKA